MWTLPELEIEPDRRRRKKLRRRLRTETFSTAQGRWVGAILSGVATAGFAYMDHRFPIFHGRDGFVPWLFAAAALFLAIFTAQAWLLHPVRRRLLRRMMHEAGYEICPTCGCSLIALPRDARCPRCGEHAERDVNLDGGR